MKNFILLITVSALCISCNKSEKAEVTSVKMLNLRGKKYASIKFRNDDGLTGNYTYTLDGIEDNLADFDVSEFGCKIGDAVLVKQSGSSLVIVKNQNIPCEWPTAD